MIEGKITKDILCTFLANLRLEDKLEFDEYIKNNNINDFYSLCLDKTQDNYFILSDDGLPCALGGAYKDKNDTQNKAQVWLLCTNEILKNKKSAFKYIFSKIQLFKEKYDFIYNSIYKTNFSENFFKSSQKRLVVIEKDLIDIHEIVFFVLYAVPDDRIKQARR